MRNKRSVCIVLFSILVSACATTSALKPKNREQILLQDEVNEFYSAWRDKNPEKLWRLLSPFIKKDNQKEEYVLTVGSALELIIDLDYKNFKVVYINKKIAVTQADVWFTFQGEVLGEGNFYQCERMIWLRFPEGWRFQESNLVCSYMPDKKRIDFLTKNIPDP